MFRRIKIKRGSDGEIFFFVQYLVLHKANLGSFPGSLHDPLNPPGIFTMY